MPKHLRRLARRNYRGPYGRERFLFDVDMLLMQTFKVRDLPDETVARIFERAQAEVQFVRGAHRVRGRPL